MQDVELGVAYTDSSPLSYERKDEPPWSVTDFLSSDNNYSRFNY